MPLNLGGGGYAPEFRWKSNRLSFVVTIQGNDGVDEMPIQLQQVLLDFWNIRTGWRLLGKGQSPQWVSDPDLTTQAPHPNPNAEWKRAFAVYAYNSQVFHGESVRLWIDSAIGSGMGVQNAYAEFEAQRAQHSRNEVPIIQLNGYTNHGQFNVPNLSVAGWTARPEMLKDAVPEPGMSAAVPTPNQPGPNPNPAPQAPTFPAPQPQPGIQQQQSTAPAGGQNLF